MSTHPHPPTQWDLLVSNVEQLRVDQREGLKGLNEKVDRVEAHVSATNGRVGRLELWQARWEGARGAYRWVLPTLTSLCSGGAVSIIVLAVSHKL